MEKAPRGVFAFDASDVPDGPDNIEAPGGVFAFDASDVPDGPDNISTTYQLLTEYKRLLESERAISAARYLIEAELRKMQEENELRRTQEADVRRKAQEEDALRKAQEEDALRKAQEEDALRKAQDETETRAASADRVRSAKTLRKRQAKTHTAKRVRPEPLIFVIDENGHGRDIEGNLYLRVRFSAGKWPGVIKGIHLASEDEARELNCPVGSIIYVIITLEQFPGSTDGAYYLTNRYVKCTSAMLDVFYHEPKTALDKTIFITSTDPMEEKYPVERNTDGEYMMLVEECRLDQILYDGSEFSASDNEAIKSVLVSEGITFEV
jgi:hypothetical protein